MGIAMDVVLIAILVLNIIIGYKKGLIKVAFNILAFLASIILVLFLHVLLFILHLSQLS